MKILPIEQVKLGMRLAQNIYRHDSLLALPKGIVIQRAELETLRYYNLEYVLVVEGGQLFNDRDDINFTLGIIEAAFKQNTLFTREFGKELYEKVYKKIIKNKKVMNYLNELRQLDSYSFAQCINVSIIISVILSLNGEADNELVNLVFLTLIHDVGRIKMKKIFSKNGKFNDREFELLRKHPEFSYKLLKKAGFTDYELKFVTETHERFDGSGYPHRLKGNEISDLAQLILIADVYNALSSYRSYREVTYSPYEVLEMIQEEKNKAFKENLVNVFLEKFVPYPIGSTVELNDGTTAIVRKLHERKKALPVVDILSDETGKKVLTIDLAFRKDLRIKRVIQTY